MWGCLLQLHSTEHTSHVFMIRFNILIFFFSTTKIKLLSSLAPNVRLPVAINSVAILDSLFEKYNKIRCHIWRPTWAFYNWNQYLVAFAETDTVNRKLIWRLTLGCLLQRFRCKNLSHFNFFTKCDIWWCAAAWAEIKEISFYTGAQRGATTRQPPTITQHVQTTVCCDFVVYLVILIHLLKKSTRKPLSHLAPNVGHMQLLIHKSFS